MNRTITIVAAMGRNRAIGFEGGMPWHLPGELAHFKRTTMGRSIVMGRKTWESIGRALPGRQNIVVTRNEQYRADGCLVVSSLVDAIEQAETAEVMVIGGGELYRQAMPLASRMVLTQIDLEPEADTWFPEWDPTSWQLVDSIRVKVDEHNPLSYEINDWVRN